MLDARCTNLYSAPTANKSQYWGNFICVSAPGGLPADNTACSGTVGGDVGVGNGGDGGQAGVVMAMPQRL